MLDDRRTFLSYPTTRDISIRQTKEYRTGRPMGKAALAIEDTISPCRVATICTNQDCLKVKWRPELAEHREDEVDVMMLCSVCRMTNYCSVSLSYRGEVSPPDHDCIYRHHVSVQIGNVTKRNANLMKKLLTMTIYGRHLAPGREQDMSTSVLTSLCDNKISPVCTVHIRVCSFNTKVNT